MKLVFLNPPSIVEGKKEFYDDVMAKNIMIFKDMLPKALKTVNDAMDSGNAKVRLMQQKSYSRRLCQNFTRRKEKMTTVQL